MYQVLLRFTNEPDLFDFFNGANVEGTKVDLNKFILQCRCKEKEIELASNSFNATVIRLISITSLDFYSVY